MTTHTIQGIEFAVDEGRGNPIDRPYLLTVIDRNDGPRTEGDLLLTRRVSRHDLADLGGFFMAHAIPFHPGGPVRVPSQKDVEDADRLLATGGGEWIKPVVLTAGESLADGLTVSLGDTSWHFTPSVGVEELDQIAKNMAPAQKAMIVALLTTIAAGLR